MLKSVQNALCSIIHAVIVAQEETLGLQNCYVYELCGHSHYCLELLEVASTVVTLSKSTHSFPLFVHYVLFGFFLEWDCNYV